MKSDKIDRAHLRDPDDRTHVIHRYPAEDRWADLIERYWLPVWSVPAGAEAPQRVLQYPVCLIVISPTYARFYGVVSGMSITTLSGDGWGAGIMFRPAAGFLLAGSVDAYTDRYVDVSEVLGESEERMTHDIRTIMDDDPQAEANHREVMERYQAEFERLLPVDAEGRLINEIVTFVETEPTVVRVAQVCERFAVTERTLQRLVRRRLGLTPKWLIQRRRLQEAAERLRDRSADAAELALLLGYADQAHFIHDFRRVTAMTPGQFSSRFGE
ncbi:helix-turn-helix domain-containing protein [Propionibacteriaceae bacterium Y2011]